ncbi:hypothetical protein [uncultured Hyphomonas sp.]|uniref:hypothetical protein n=1 Tax=uncultured Hyphomonas sp. TaxID=225298 RepID=UPI002AAC0322|nr:hypothetical protein [uncultured Hyphomonas sp.]
MWSKRALAGAALATLLSCPASAQIEDSWLEQVDPWGISYLGEDEPALRTRMWRGASGEDLLALMQDARTKGLSPAEQILMRRLVLSGGRAPEGEEGNALLAERARIAFELGEAAAAAGQFAELKTPPPGVDAPAMAADLNLVLGNEATACEALNTPNPESDYWPRLRAVCAALAGNTSGAELAMEIAQAQGVEDSWLSSAIFAMSGVAPTPPKAKFDSGIGFVMSNRAFLEVTPDAVPADRADIAAAMARRKLTPPDVRVKAAQIAAEAGLIDREEFRIAYNSALAADGFNPRTLLSEAMFAAADGTSSDADTAEAIAAALIEAEENPAHFAATASLLRAGMAKLPLGPDTEDKAFLFARANIAAGEMDEALRWVTPPEPEPEPVPEPAAQEMASLEAIGPAPEDGVASVPANLLIPDGITIETGGTAQEAAPGDETSAGELSEDGDLLPEEDILPEPPTFEAAWIGALIILADAEASKDAIRAAAENLIAAAENEDKAEAAARIFALWTAAGTAPPSEARSYLSIHSPVDESSSAPGDAIAVWAAARSGTAAEVVLRTVSLTNGDASELGLADITLILAALEDIGAEDAARLMALEATGYWKEAP